MVIDMQETLKSTLSLRRVSEWKVNELCLDNKRRRLLHEDLILLCKQNHFFFNSIFFVDHGQTVIDNKIPCFKYRQKKYFTIPFVIDLQVVSLTEIARHFSGRINIQLRYDELVFLNA